MSFGGLGVWVLGSSQVLYFFSHARRLTRSRWARQRLGMVGGMHMGFSLSLDLVIYGGERGGGLGMVFIFLDFFFGFVCRRV